MLPDDPHDRLAGARPPPGERLHLVLLGLRAGRDRERIARELPSQRGIPGSGVSEGTLRQLERAAFDRLLKAVVADRPPPGLPPQLWPPTHVRRAIRELAGAGAPRRLQLAALRRWLLPMDG